MKRCNVFVYPRQLTSTASSRRTKRTLWGQSIAKNVSVFCHISQHDGVCYGNNLRNHVVFFVFCGKMLLKTVLVSDRQLLHKQFGLLWLRLWL